MNRFLSFQLKTIVLVTLFIIAFSNIQAQDNASTSTDDLLATNKEMVKSTPADNNSTKKSTATPDKNTTKASKSVLSIARIEGFNAFSDNRSIRVNWTTTSERNSKKIILERRSESEKDYTEVDYVMGRGTTYEKGNFYLFDYETKSGTRYFYRLKMINDDDEFQYSKVISGEM